MLWEKAHLALSWNTITRLLLQSRRIPLPERPLQPALVKQLISAAGCHWARVTLLCGKTITVQDICMYCRWSFGCYNVQGTGGDIWKETFENLQMSSSCPLVTSSNIHLAALHFQFSCQGSIYWRRWANPNPNKHHAHPTSHFLALRKLSQNNSKFYVLQRMHQNQAQIVAWLLNAAHFLWLLPYTMLLWYD